MQVIFSFFERGTFISFALKAVLKGLAMGFFSSLFGIGQT